MEFIRSSFSKYWIGDVVYIVDSTLNQCVIVNVTLSATEDPTYSCKVKRVHGTQHEENHRSFTSADLEKGYKTLEEAFEVYRDKVFDKTVEAFTNES